MASSVAEVTQTLSELTSTDFQKLCQQLVSRGSLKEETYSTTEELLTVLTSSLGKDEAYNVINASFKEIGYLAQKQSTEGGTSGTSDPGGASGTSSHDPQQIELEQLRPEFISQVSFSLLHQLFDDLLNFKILSHGQIREILLQSPDVRQQAQSLIDLVLQKGPGASDKMLYFLNLRDRAFIKSCKAESRKKTSPQKLFDPFNYADAGISGSLLSDITDLLSVSSYYGDSSDSSDSNDSSDSSYSSGPAFGTGNTSGSSSSSGSSGTSGTSGYDPRQIELEQLRSDFTSQVSFSLLNQLLDDLLKAHVLSPFQIQEIVSQGLDVREQAKSLIDMVLHKGPEASWNMLFFLKERDPSSFQFPKTASKKRKFYRKRRHSKAPKAVTIAARLARGISGVRVTSSSTSAGRGASGTSGISGTSGSHDDFHGQWVLEELPNLQELPAFRSEFMSQSVIFRLMDDLEVDHILSPEEKSIVILLNPDIRSMVFHLNYLVGLNGPEASTKMLHCLRRIEPRLYGHGFVDRYEDTVINAAGDVDIIINKLNVRGVAVSDDIKAIHNPHEKMLKLIDSLKSVEQKQIFNSILQEREPQTLNTMLMTMQTDPSYKHFEMLSAKWFTQIPTVAEEEWAKLKPCVRHDGSCTWYSFNCVPGKFECSVSGLRWICKDSPLSFEYRFDRWWGHKNRIEGMGYMAAGPLLDITVSDGQFDEVYLPHWICTTVDPTILERFAVLHSDNDGITVEKVSEVTPSHVKLQHPVFSAKGTLFRLWRWAGFPVSLECKVLIYRTKKTFLTLHVYLIPSDPALQEELQKKAEMKGYEFIEKPYPQGTLEMDDQVNLRTDVDDAEISPMDFKFKYESRDPNFFEVFIQRPRHVFTLKLENAAGTVWRCTIRQFDYSSAGASVPEVRTYDDELLRVRVNFVERVSEEVTLQLLDDLLRVVLNDGERDAITTGNVLTTHKARALIDTVRKKGPDASMRMIFHLERRDCTLHGLLGLPSIPSLETRD